MIEIDTELPYPGSSFMLEVRGPFVFIFYISLSGYILFCMLPHTTPQQSISTLLHHLVELQLLPLGDLIMPMVMLLTASISTVCIFLRSIMCMSLSENFLHSTFPLKVYQSVIMVIMFVFI